MRPLRISIEGLRSFRSEVEIDFGDRAQIAVIGDTGAGKSSILEAVTYALYGQTSLGGRSKQELMNDTSDVMRVVLRFRVGGEECEVTRVDRRTGAGGLGPARAQLVRYGPGGQPVEKVEQVRPVTERVQELIGLDSDAFLRTVILPQGRFARLLVEDTPSARTEILRQVWRTHDLEAAGEAAGNRLGEVATLAARLNDEVARWPDDPQGRLFDLESRADEASRREGALVALVERSGKARDSVRQSETTVAAARRASERVTPSTMDELADRLAPLEGAQRRIEAEATEMEARDAALRRDLNAIPGDDGPDDRQVARALAVLDAIPNEVERAVAEAEALRGAIAAEAEAERRHVQAKQGLDSATDRVSRHQTLEPPLRKARVAAADSLNEAERRLEKCGDLRERIGSEEEALVHREEALIELTARLAAAQREQKEAQERLWRSDQRFSEAQRANQAAAAAHGLCPGDECPVCRRDLPEDWLPPEDAGLDEAREAHRAARSQSDEARRTAAHLEAQRTSARNGIASVTEELGSLQSDLAGSLDRLRGAALLDASFLLAADAPLPDREQILAPVKQRLVDAETELSDHRTEAAELGRAHTSSQMAERSARQAREHAISDIERGRSAAGKALRTLHRSLQSIPAPFRPEMALAADPVELQMVDITSVDRASYAAKERADVLQLREQKRRRLRDEIEETTAALKILGETRKREVENPLQALVGALADHRITLTDAVRDLDADTEVPAAVHYPVDAETLRKGISRLRAAMAELTAMADDRRRHAVAVAEEARMEARRVAGQLDPPADPADLDALVRSAGRAADEARYAARDATRERDAFAAILDDLVDLRRAADEISALALALGDLDAALKPGAFLKWLTLRRSRDLLVYASRMLEEMTRGRYSFADPGDLPDQQWLVVDTDSGQARSPASLSGGEQFIGSLALALGMVEMMARSGGRLESLFLDEGFGSLDRSNLDSAIAALTMVAARGRMVGVISHVGAVAEQIDDVLAVTRGASGSQATWLTRTQRQELARADVGFEGASALAGLLE